MYAELYQYFILHKQLSLPGIGNFQLERKPAQGDFVNRKIMAPSFTISLQPFAEQPAAKFFKWLAGTLSVTDRDAVIRFNEFVFDIKKQISNGDVIEWNGMGKLNKGLGGEIKFIPSVRKDSFGETSISEEPVTAEKVIRDKAEHMVRVGENEKTSAEMEEMLGEKIATKSYWWIAPLIIGLLAAGFIGWHLYNNGTDVSAFGNNTKLKTSEISATYQIVQ